MSTSRVDLLNAALMLIACGAAFLLPFEAFLFGYAILGPLHYLTEIAWLHQRDYFMPRRRHAAWLVLMLLPVLVFYHGRMTDLSEAWTPVLSAGAVGAALAFVFLRGTGARLAAIGASLLTGLLVADTRGGHDMLRLFLPTILHVWLFTAAFVLLGALKNRSRTGFASLGVFAACTIACFAAPVTEPLRAVTERTADAYVSVAALNVGLADWFGFAPIADGDGLFLSERGLILGRFIAFAYVYHYFNWFSKTSVIQWHKMPKSWAMGIVAIWIASLALYSIDFRVGLQALFALSYLHVFLEFPLNGLSFAEIGRHLSGARA